MPQLAALHFLHPAAGRLALLGLLVPLLIYLWNRRPARVVQVGSLRWLETAANRLLRRLRPEQLGLLLLRAAVVGLLAAAVAAPRWPRPPRPVRGQVLVEPALLQSAALAAVRPVIDSLRERGYELRQLRRGFPRLPAPTWARLDSVPGAADSLLPAPAENLWARAQQAADSFPKRPLRVFTTARLAAFAGARPALPTRLRWQLVPTADSARWLQAAALVGADSLRLLVGRSTEEQTGFQTITMKKPLANQIAPVAGLPALRYLATDSGAVLQSAGREAVAVRAAPVRVWLRADAGHATEARYWRAAVQAASIGFAAPLRLTSSADAAPDILLWLTDAPVPARQRQRVAQGMQLWRTGTGAGRAVVSQLTPPAAAPVSLLRLDTVRTAAAELLWTNAAGRAVLTRQAAGRGAEYRLHTPPATRVERPGRNPDSAGPATAAAATRSSPRPTCPPRPAPTGPNAVARVGAGCGRGNACQS